MLSSILAIFLALIESTVSFDPRSNDVHQNSLSPPSPPLPLSLTNSESSFYITALTNHPTPPYNARLQCWLLDKSLSTYPTVGKSLPLGPVDNMTYVVLPPRSAEGWHRPPHAMFFVLLSGVAQVYVPGRNCPNHLHAEHVHDNEGPAQPLPNDQSWDAITITPGNTQQVLIAADTDARSLGHLTFYPGDGETVALQITLRDGGLEELGYKVVHEGGCTGDEGLLRALREDLGVQGYV